MAAWSSWYQDIQLQVPGCPVPVIDHALRRAAQAFFTGSRTWLVSPSPMPVAATQAEVVVDLGNPEQELVRVEAAWLDGTQLEVRQVFDLDDMSEKDWTSSIGSARVIVQMSPFALRLYPVPQNAATEGLRVRVSVRPSDAATGVPDPLAMRFRDELATGAKARLLLQAGQPWANPDLGAELMRLFDGYISSANLIAARSFGRARFGTVARWF